MQNENTLIEEAASLRVFYYAHERLGIICLQSNIIHVH